MTSVFNFNEFKRADLKMSFNYFDTDCKGYIDSIDIKELYKRKGIGEEPINYYKNLLKEVSSKDKLYFSDFCLLFSD